MPSLKITKRAVEALQPTAGRVYLWDTEVKGFGLMATKAGAKTYIVQYRSGGRGSPTRRMTIGTHGSPWEPESARDKAKKLLRQVDDGLDPRAMEIEARRAINERSAEAVVRHFINTYGKQHQPRSWEETERVLNREFVPAFKGRAIETIRRSEIAGLLDDTAARAPALARLTHAFMRKLFRWCVARGVLEVSPMADMPPPTKIPSRDRVLTDDELVWTWQATSKLGGIWEPFFRLLLLTGQRREEVAAMRWAEISGTVWTIPGSRTKNGRPHLVPLNLPAVAELDRWAKIAGREGFVFSTTGETAVSGISKAKSRLDAQMLALARKSLENDEAELEPWRIHDLRRTLATGLQRLGVRIEVTEAVLNHLSGTRAGIVGVYQRHDFAKEKRRALDLWSQHLSALIARADGSNVVKFRRAE